eukprot:Skav208142  [mRNA]  locus=scaffold235:57872:60712:+ [translate_table: standard]
MVMAVPWGPLGAWAMLRHALRAPWHALAPASPARTRILRAGGCWLMLFELLEMAMLSFQVSLPLAGLGCDVAGLSRAITIDGEEREDEDQMKGNKKKGKQQTSQKQEEEIKEEEKEKEEEGYGIALAALGMLATLSCGLTIDGFGPISDNAGGIAEAGQRHPRGTQGYPLAPPLQVVVKLAPGMSQQVDERPGKGPILFMLAMRGTGF